MSTTKTQGGSKFMTAKMMGVLSLMSIIIFTSQITTWRISSSLSSPSSSEATQTQEISSVVHNTNSDNSTRLLSSSSLSPIIFCHTSGYIEIPAGTSQRLGIASAGVLCTLTRVNGNAKELVPVGRSYNNNQWETVAGTYKNVSYTCHDDFCEVTIPEISKEGDTFHLTGFQRSLSKRDEAARFFEQASFGVTESDLKKVDDEIMSNPDRGLLPYFAKWIHEQTYKVQPTSHRAVYRERLSPIYQDAEREGRPTLPCEKGSIWRGYTFSPHDRNRKLVVKSINGRYEFKIDGKIRSMVNKFSFVEYPNYYIDLSKPFKICGAKAGTFKRVSLMYDGVCRTLAEGNPPISMEGMDTRPATLTVIETEEIQIQKRKARIELIKTKSIAEDSICGQDNYDDHVFTQFHNGKFMQHLLFEPRLVLQENALESPLQDGGRKNKNNALDGQCTNSPRTFLNEKHCRLSNELACASQEFTASGLLHLTPTNLKKMYEEEKKYVYAITDLRLDKIFQKSPCVHGVRSRWEIVQNTCEENVHTSTASILREMFRQSDDKNIYVKDLYLPEDKQCNVADLNNIEMEVQVGTDCWRTVHPNHMNVYDFTLWQKKHPGNSIGFKPISKPAKQGGHVITFPTHHLMSRWTNYRENFAYLGRLGDSIAFNNMPSSLRTHEIADIFGLVTAKQDDQFTVVCGSPFETTNGNHLSLFFMMHRRPNKNFYGAGKYGHQKRTVWTMTTTSASDQLRQRMAWALSQLFAISPEATEYPYMTESFLAYYDTFVRHSMGNFRDILKEVAFSPLMAQMLSYLESKSSEFVWNHQKEIQFADENFAREIMQLFSIGLVKLNTDGTNELDSRGETIATYNNDDITEYSRLWTGFRDQMQRGNTEERGHMNSLDPMAIHLPWRDQFPKMGLDGKYVGDEYALCSDLPSDSFLSKGAKYRLLGSSQQSDLQNILPETIIPRLDDSSLLFNRLCQRNSNNDCSYPGVVYLSENINCRGIECSLLSDPKIVQLTDSVYYEYVRPPCVHFPFSKTKGTNIVINSDGRVAILDNDLGRTPDSLTFFRVDWKSEFPHVDNSCGRNTCQARSGTCICQTSVENSRVFDSLPTRVEVLSQLHVGAMSPYLYKYHYARPCKGFGLFYNEEMYGMNSAFRVKDDFGRTQYLKNMRSNVVILQSESDERPTMQFRNTPTFYGDEPEVMDALYETEAGLDHYFYHQNTGPFLALRFIQRFGISNPSPRFVQTVVQAFVSGKFVAPDDEDSLSFGSGEYGDLSATVAAILLDRESRDFSLDFDPSFGAIREPIIKVISLLRSMEYTQTDGNFISLYDLDTVIGQMAHDVPSVFSFFLPEYKPPGVCAKASLVAPEAMLLQNSVGLVNGMLSLINLGMSHCYGGFGEGKQDCNEAKSRSGSIGSNVGAGHLSYVPEGASYRTNYAEFVVDNLATMLTSGRLSKYHREIIKEAYLSESNKIKAYQLAQKLTILSPEYHVTAGVVQETVQKRPPTRPTIKVCKEYKAVVHILLKGGCDSFNLLVPHSQCHGKDMYDEYKNVRGPIALEKEDLLPIDAESSNQICSSFGIHPKLPVLKKLYDEKEAIFLAGIGVLSEPVDKTNYESKTKTQLFAHNTVQAEISRLDPYLKARETGTLGRLADVLSGENGNSVNTFAIDSTLVPLEGTQDGIVRVAVHSKRGFEPFNPLEQSMDSTVNEKFRWINGEQDSYSSMFTETWSSSLHNSVSTGNRLSQAQKSVKLKAKFPDTKLGSQFDLVSRMIASRECRGSNKDIFFIETGRFDHHKGLVTGLETEFQILNDGLESFTNEIKGLPGNVWDDVTVVVSSDFGRSMTSNSGGGSDHGWSGNTFILGGSINGGQILGTYPDDLTSDSPLDVGRGRFIPTMPFEAPWNAVIDWLDMKDNIDKILPNRMSFPEEMLLKKEELFLDKGRTINECKDSGKVVSCIALDDEITSVE